MGASPGALDSIERFFAKLTVGVDQAIVLALQDHWAFDEPRLREVVRNSNGGKLVGIADGHAVEGGTIYLCPPAMITTIRGDRFAIREAAQAPGERATIDSLLVSLAEERAAQSIGVLLAGTGGDGTLGTATLKDQGGLAIAEKVTSQEEAGHLVDGNTPASIADYVLPPEEIPEHINDLLIGATRERLQATIEELVSTNKELKSSNEAYQSRNEALRSVNEELTTVNGELAHRVQELTRATSDLKNSSRARISPPCSSTMICA